MRARKPFSTNNNDVRCLNAHTALRNVYAYHGHDTHRCFDANAFVFCVMLCQSC